MAEHTIAEASPHRRHLTRTRRQLHLHVFLYVKRAGPPNAGHRDIPAQLGVAVRGRDRVRGDPRQPVARADPPAGGQRDGPLEHGAHEGVDAGGHRLHLPGHRECWWSIKYQCTTEFNQCPVWGINKDLFLN